MPEPTEEEKAAAAATAASVAQAAADAAVKAAADKAAEDALGDAGKRALAAERAAAEAARQEAAATKKELEALKALQMTDQEKALAAAKAEGASSVTATVNDRLLAAEIRAAAAGHLAEPTDAVKFLDLTKFTVADDGSVDTTAISAAIAELLVQKPYLAAAKATGGSGDQGARRTGNATPDADTMSMSEYIAARKAGTIQ